MTRAAAVLSIAAAALSGCGDDGVADTDGGAVVDGSTGMPDGATARDGGGRTDGSVVSTDDGGASDGGVVDGGSGGEPTIIDVTDPDMDPRQGYAAGAVGDGRVIIAGGFGGTNTPNETWSFDPTTTEWTALADLPAPHINATANVLTDGRMLISGGIPSQFATTSNDGIFVFDLTTSTWSSAGTMTDHREVHASFLLHRGPDAGKYVMFGGSRRTPSGAVYLDSFELYDPVTEMSTALPGTALPSGRASAMTFERTDGTIVIAGGYTTPGDPTGSAIDQILVYDPMDHSVAVQTQTLPEAQLYLPLGALPDGRILVFPAYMPVSNAILAMDLDALTFDTLGDLPDITVYGAALVPSGDAWVFGGREGGTLTDAVRRYEPLTDTWTTYPGLLPLALAGIRTTVIPDGRVLLFGGQTAMGFIVGQTLLFTP